jgi:hypothetical protein
MYRGSLRLPRPPSSVSLSLLQAPTGSLALTPSGSLALTPSGSLALTPSGSLALTPSGSLALTPSGSLALSVSGSLCPIMGMSRVCARGCSCLVLLFAPLCASLHVAH